MSKSCYGSGDQEKPKRASINPMRSGEMTSRDMYAGKNWVLVTQTIDMHGGKRKRSGSPQAEEDEEEYKCKNLCEDSEVKSFPSLNRCMFMEILNHKYTSTNSLSRGFYTLQE